MYDEQHPNKGDVQMGEVKMGPWRVRCTATSKGTGTQCKLWATRGMHVCRIHGGGGAVKHPDEPHAEHHPATTAAQRIEAVKERLTELGDQALATVSEVLIGKIVIDGVEVPTAEAKDRLKAAEMVLDRMVGRKIETATDPEEHKEMDAKIEAVMETMAIKQQEEAG